MRRVCVAGVVVLAIVLVNAALAAASPITWAITGTVNHVRDLPGAAGAIARDDWFTLLVTFDNEAEDLRPDDPMNGYYESPVGVPYGMVFLTASYVLADDAVAVTAHNETPDGNRNIVVDYYDFENTPGRDAAEPSIWLTLVQERLLPLASTETMLTSDRLLEIPPAGPLAANGFGNQSWLIVGFSNGGFLAARPDAVFVIPEPATAALVGLGALFVIGRRRRSI